MNRRQLILSPNKSALFGVCAGIVALFAAPLAASAQDAIAAPAQKTIGQPQSTKGDMIPSLAVINSRGATLQGNILTMTDVGLNSIVFADRPYRAAGHVLTKHFLKEWDEGSDSFAKDPPNATISVLSTEGDTVEDAVVTLKSPKLEDDKLTFQVTVLEGGLSKATGPASLFIDWFAARGYGGRGFVAGGGGWHGAWYGHPNYGAVAGAAALGIGAAAVVTASVVGSGAQIGPGAVLDGVVIGERARIDGGNELRCGMRVWPGVQLGPTAVRFSADA